MGLFRKLVLVFTLVPLVEFILFWKLGSLIGLPITIAIIVITGFLGAWLSKVQGYRTLANYQKALSEGRLPHQEVVDGVLILLAGAVLLTPGFLTDIVGFSLLVPPVREKVRGYLGKRLKDKINIVGGPDFSQPSQASTSSEDVITVETEVIDEKPDSR